MIFGALLIEILTDKHYYWRGFLGIFWLRGAQNGGLMFVMRVIFRKNMIMKELTPAQAYPDWLGQNVERKKSVN